MKSRFLSSHVSNQRRLQYRDIEVFNGMFRVQKYKTTMKDCGDEAKKDGDELKVIANVCRSKKMYKCHFTDGNEEETTTMLSEAEKQRLATLILRITLLAMSALFLV